MNRRIIEPRFFGRIVKRTVIKMIELFVSVPAPIDRFEGTPHSILIIAQEKLGDSILLTPLLKNLRRVLPDTQIHLAVVRHNIEEFFGEDPNVDRIINARGRTVKAIRELRKTHYDLLFNTKDHLSFTFVWLTLFARAKCKVGIRNPHYSKFYNHLMDIDQSQHIALKNCALLGYLGCGYTIQDCRPYLPPAMLSPEVETFAQTIGNNEIVGINISTGDPDRALSLQKWEQVLSRVTDKVIVFAMPGELPLKRKLEERFDHVLPSPQTNSLAEVGELLKNLKLLITPDTSLIHLASCFNVPVLGLYQNQDALQGRFYPFLIKYKLVTSATHRVDDIPVDDIVLAARETIDLLSPEDNAAADSADSER
jgi:heptosyltransferase III